VNPRYEWTVGIGRVFGVLPWQMEDLSPPELDAMKAATSADAPSVGFPAHLVEHG